MSVAGHAAFFMVLVLWLGLEFEQALNNRPLVIHLQSHDTDGTLSDNTELDKTVESDEEASSASPVEEEITTDTENKFVNVESRAAASVNTTSLEQQSTAAAIVPQAQELEDAGTADETSTDSELLPAASLDVLTTVQASGQTVSPGRNDAGAHSVRKVSMSPKQEKMLNKRIEKWAGKLHKMDQPMQEQVWQHNGQQYTARIKRLPAKDNMDIEQVVVEISTEKNGRTMSTEMRMKRLAFSNFTQLLNRWDPGVHMHDDELDGRFHSNSEINLLASGNVIPRFYGKVTTASRQVNMGGAAGSTRRGKVFLGGLETGVDAIELPKHFAPFPEHSTVDDDQIHYFDKDTRIRFYADGAYSWQTAGSSLPEQRRRLDDRTHYLVGAKKTELLVQGIVSGKVLVYSPERIIIEGNLVYAHDPETAPDAGNYLGLVSDKSVEIAGPDVTGPGDLSIHASIYAKRRFLVSHFRAKGTALLFIYGSVTAGSLSATEPRYRTKIQFDRRLEKKRPPGFPVTDRYEVASWDTDWKIQ